MNAEATARAWSQEILEPRARLAIAVLNELVAPLIAAGYLDLDGAVIHLKCAVVQRMDQAGVPRTVLANHFSWSERTVYRYLGPAKLRRRPARARNLLLVDGLKHAGGDSAGHALMQEILDLLLASPTPMDLLEILAALKRTRHHVDREALQGALLLYGWMGHVATVMYDDRLCFTCLQPQGTLAGDGSAGRLKVLQQLLPVLLAALNGESQALMVQGEIPADRLAVTSESLRRAVRQSIRQAEDEAPEGETKVVRALLLVGLTGSEPTDTPR